MAWILDLDGVIWLTGDPIPGAAEAVERLRAAGERTLFVTNNSSVCIQPVLERLAEAGVDAGEDDLVTSAQAAAAMVEEGSTALVCAGPGVGEALEARGVRTTRDGPADVVVVGYHREFDYERLTAAFHALQGGARLIGTNDDATYPTPDGPIPGGGSILAAVATAAGVDAEVAGKPHQPMADLLRARLGDTGGEVIVVGDRPSTDGLMARRMGARFALVLSGVTSEDQLPVDPSPDVVAPDLAALVGPSGELVEEQSNG